jgi:hypothetical protein
LIRFNQEKWGESSFQARKMGRGVIAIKKKWGDQSTQRYQLHAD